MFSILLAVGSFLVILAMLVLLRWKNSRFEVKASDMVVAVLPVIVVLLVTGKLQKLEIGDLKIETAFVKASTAAIAKQVTPLTGLPSEPIQIGPKSGKDQIPQLIENKAEGLLFRLGHGGYSGIAIQEYFVTLSKQPFLKYMIIEDRDGSFCAMANARQLTDIFQAARPPYTAENLARWLNEGDKSALARLPGFVSSENALNKDTNKNQALGEMEKLNTDVLPVVDAKHFVGIVNRSRLTASLLLEVAQTLENK